MSHFVVNVSDEVLRLVSVSCLVLCQQLYVVQLSLNKQVIVVPQDSE